MLDKTYDVSCVELKVLEGQINDKSLLLQREEKALERIQVLYEEGKIDKETYIKREMFEVEIY